MFITKAQQLHINQMFITTKSFKGEFHSFCGFLYVRNPQNFSLQILLATNNSATLP